VTVHGAPLALRRAIVNLVENALKYGARARLRLGTADRNAVLDIDDDGPGIPEAQQQQVFEPFFRLEASRNRDTGGIGLGLATAQAIALDHGGEITLSNRRGGGLRATLRLPLPG
jgi:two-component system OmpR family sensor kinase